MNGLTLKSMTLVNRRGFFGSKGSNQNRPFHVVDVLVPLSEEDAKNNSFGFEIKTIFLEKELWLQIKPEDIGKTISFTYECNEFGTPVVSSFKLESYLLSEEEE